MAMEMDSRFRANKCTFFKNCEGSKVYEMDGWYNCDIAYH